MININELIEVVSQKNDEGEFFTPVEQMLLMQTYLAENLEDTEHDKELVLDAIYAGRQQICENIIRLQDEKDLFKNEFQPESDKDEWPDENINVMLSKFIKEPVSALKDNLNLYQTIANVEVENGSNVDRNKVEKATAAANILQGKEAEARNFGKDLNAELNKCKGSFWERVFKTTSKEYKEFEQALKDRSVNECTKDTVMNKAVAYLMHKIPGYDGEGLPKESDIMQLTGAGKERALLAYRTLIRESASNIYSQKIGDLEREAEQNIQKKNQGVELYPRSQENEPFDYEKFHAKFSQMVSAKEPAIEEKDLNEDKDINDNENNSIIEEEPAEAVENENDLSLDD